MPLILPKDLPAFSTLLAEGAPVVTAAPKGMHTRRILLLNLMPIKPATELDFARALSAASEDEFVELLLMKISGQTYKNTPQEYVEHFYTDFEQFEPEHFDGLIVTGAPIEHLEFEQVRYWPQLEHIFTWATTHVTSTLYVCWGAQAGLYFHYGVPKYGLPEKKFGIFPQTVLRPDEPIFADFPAVFPMPHSRHTEVRRADIEKVPALTLLSFSEESGVSLALSNGGREFFITGHLEYEPFTLDNEYRRDLGKGLPIHEPSHYYDAEKKPIDSWRNACRLFYRNWIRIMRK